MMGHMTAARSAAADDDVPDRAPENRAGENATAGDGAAEAARPGSMSTSGWTAQMNALGDFIRAQRQLANLSLREMASMTSVSNAYLSQVERGLHQPSIRVLRAIAEALNVSADTLLTQAGLLDGVPPTSTETAIRNDPLLSPADREALIRVYRSLRKEPPDHEQE